MAAGQWRVKPAIDAPKGGVVMIGVGKSGSGDFGHGNSAAAGQEQAKIVF